MKTDIIEHEFTEFLSMVRTVKDQKLSEFPRMSTLLNNQVDFLDQDLQLLLQVLKADNVIDLLKIMKNINERKSHYD